MQSTYETLGILFVNQKMRGGAWGKEFEVLWKNFAPPKAAATAWTALWNRLPTRTNLRKRKVLDFGYFSKEKKEK